MEKKHDLVFCAQCGVKLDGDEVICSVCGYKLAELHPFINVIPPTPPLPVTETPDTPPAIDNPPIIPPVNEVPVSPIPLIETPSSFCPNCGVKIEEHEIFCNGCGLRLTEINDQKPVENIPPPVAETPVAPPPPIAEAPVIIPPVIETPVTPPPVVEIPVTPPSPPVEAPPSFCPNCGIKTEVNVVFCSGCGFNLKEINNPTPIINVPPPVVVPPKVETPVQPVFQNTPPVQQPQIYYPAQTPKKKGMGAGWWILIVFLIVIVLGGGTVAFLQYNGTINIEFLSDYIPSKDSQSANTTTADPTRYYVVNSFAVVGTKWTAIISDVIVSRKEFNNQEGAKNQFKKAIMNRFPKDYQFFTQNITVNQYTTYTEAQSAHSATLKSYGSDPKNYDIRTINFGY